MGQGLVFLDDKNNQFALKIPRNLSTNHSILFVVELEMTKIILDFWIIKLIFIFVLKTRLYNHFMDLEKQCPNFYKKIRMLLDIFKLNYLNFSTVESFI